MMVSPVDNAERHDKAVFILSTHGGHLGFYEGGLFKPNPVTWLDRTAVGIADAIISDKQHSKMIK